MWYTLSEHSHLDEQKSTDVCTVKGTTVLSKGRRGAVGCTSDS